jgi:hypothetical protein
MASDVELIRLYGDLVERIVALESVVEDHCRHITQLELNQQSVDYRAEYAGAQQGGGSFKDKAVAWLRERKARGDI